MQYEYTEVGENERQYDHLDLTEHPIVDAIYVKSDCADDRGNPYIECLPRPKTAKELLNDYRKTLTEYDWDKQLTLSAFSRMQGVMQLREVRFILPFMISLQDDFALMLIESYRCRSIRKSPKKVVISDESQIVDYVSEGKLAGSTNTGLALIGYSGCGKTTSMSMILSEYPQVLVHHPDDQSRFAQIVYLYIVCPANSNFTALYVSIGRAIDRALGNAEPVYEDVIRKNKSIGAMANKVCELIDIFHIGALVFDEIQLIEFEGSKESTFESLLTIVNNTKVALIVLGTEDSYKKMFPNLRTARRVGAIIEASQYCGNRDFFAHICKQLFKYQWFNEWVELTGDMIDTLYSLSYGIIDQLVSLYIYMNLTAIRSQKPIVVNSEFIEVVSNKHFPGLKQLIKDLKDNQKSVAEFEEQRKAICAKAGTEAMRQLLKMETQEAMSAIQLDEERKTTRNYDQIFRNVTHNIKTLLEMSGEVYSDEMIAKAVRHIMGLKKNADADEKTITQQAFQWLRKAKSDSMPKTKKPIMDAKHLEIRNMLEQTTV